MEEWQKKTVTENLPQLIVETEFNVVVKAALIATNILTPTDVEILDAESDRKGKTTASYNYYDRLMKSVGAYQILTKILEENLQTGAARILMNGFRNLGIPKDLDGFNDIEIDVQGKIRKIHEFFPAEKLELAHEIFRDTIPEVELYEAFVKKQKIFVLAVDTIPPEPPLYIPRFLSNRIEINESVFKSDCPDVFVFRNTIERYKLSQIARPHPTDTSTSQVIKLTRRFIYLDELDDWYELKKSAKVPIHLILYEADRQIYLLEDTSAGLDILRKVGSKRERVYLTEDEFVHQQLSENSKISSVCICDTPGMGKTFLLANIARRMTNHCSGTVFAYIQLSTFAADYSFSSKRTTEDQETVLSNVLKHVAPSHEHTKLLIKLVQAELLLLEIYFDGFDEIPADKFDWLKQVFLSVKSKLPNVRIYITSRPHMRHELEKSLGVVAYDILPFNLQNQVDYLVQFWYPNVPQLDKTLLENYASRCLKEVNETLTRNDKELAGIPLLCRLIAAVYANKVQIYTTTESRNMNFTLKIPQMYEKFIQQRIQTTTSTEEEMMNIKLVHIWHALKLLFPMDGFHDDKMFRSIDHEMALKTVLNAGIIQLHSSQKLEFIHRTFAEYFAAEYFSKKISMQRRLQSKPFFRQIFSKTEPTKKCLDSLLATFEQEFADIDWGFFLQLDERLVLDSHYVFVHSVIVSFVDFSLNDVRISEEIKSTIASFCASIKPDNFFSVLCACFHNNLHNLFSLLIEALTKWNWYQKKKHFSRRNCSELLSLCIKKSTSQMFQSCIRLLTEVLKLNLTQIDKFDGYESFLSLAVRSENYEAVEYFVDRVSLKNQALLKKCSIADEIEKKENILHLLLNKEPTLIDEASEILVNYGTDAKLFQILVKFGADLTAVNRYRKNFAMHAAEYMSPSDYHELVQFLLTDCKADYLFLEHEKWERPLPHIFDKLSLLPETMELLLNISGVDINMKDRWEESLLFFAVNADDLNEFEQLTKRGVDYNARGLWNRSLLHLAAKLGRVEMVRYLLSLELDPNSRDDNQWTPLHYAAYYNELSVVEVLVENGADIQAKNNEYRTPLHSSAIRNSVTSAKKIRYLIGQGAGVNNRDNKGNTPLHLCNNQIVKELLIKLGADIDAKNNEDETPAQMNPDLWESSN